MQKKTAMQKKLQCKKTLLFGRSGWRCLPGPPLNHSRLNPKLKPQHQAQTRPTRPARPDAKKTAMQKKLQCKKNFNAKKKLLFGGGPRRCLPGPPLNHSRPDPKLKLQHWAQTRPARPAKPARPARPDATPTRCSSEQLVL